MYPFDQPNWTASDQKYWFNMCRKFRYPVTSVREPHRYLIEENKDDVWEQEYQDYLDTKSAQ
jgi:hypothetical protein